LRLAIGLAPFWWARGSLREGRRWLEMMLALPGEAPTALLARGHREVAVFATASGATDIATAEPAAVATGMRVTFAIAAGLMIASLAIVIAGRMSLLKDAR